MNHAAPHHRNFDTPKHPVLVVDGDASRRESLVQELRAAGRHAVATGDMFYVLALLASDASIRAMVLNIDWSTDFSARTLVVQAQSLRPTLPIVFMTGAGATSKSAGLPPESRILAWPLAASTLNGAIDETIAVAVQQARHPSVVDSKDNFSVRTRAATAA